MVFVAFTRAHQRTHARRRFGRDGDRPGGVSCCCDDDEHARAGGGATPRRPLPVPSSGGVARGRAARHGRAVGPGGRMRRALRATRAAGDWLRAPRPSSPWGRPTGRPAGRLGR